MIQDKHNLIERLTGVKSSKRSYYTELKKTIRQLEKKNMKLEIINDVMKSFKVNMSMDELLGNVMEKLKQIITFDRLSLALFQNQQLILTNVYPLETSYLQIGTVLPKQNSIYWQASEQKEVVFYSLTKEKQLLSSVEEKEIKELQLQDVLLIPLISKETVIGVVSFGCKKQIEYDTSDLQFLQQLADQLAVFIENAQLYHAVLQGKKEWEETFRAVLDMLIFIDMDKKIIRFNDSVPKFFQLDANDLLGKYYHELVFTNLESKKKCPIEICYQTKESAYRQVTLKNQQICDVYTYPVFNEAKAMYGVIVYIKDVTDKVHTEAKLIQSDKLAAIGEMAAGVAHELNSPLTAILGNSQLLLRTAQKETSSYYLLQDIKNCGDRCKKIIRNLLTFSRQDEHVFQDCSLNVAITQVLSLIGYQIERQNITVVPKLLDNLPLVNGSIQQIEQVVINLLLNAKDALAECEHNDKKIIVETNVEEIDGLQWVTLAICDNGVGIVEKDLQEIFHPFFTTKEAIKGTGLGLSVSLGIAKMHGGTMKVTSKVGEGSCFTLLLPGSEAHV